MQRTIIGLTTADGHTGELESVDGGDWVIDVQETLTYLDGAEVCHGYAGTHDTVEKERAVIGAGTVDFETREVRTPVATEFFADLSSGFVCVDSSDGECMFDADGLIKRATQVDVVRAHLDVPSFAEHLLEQYGESVDWWQVGWRREDDGETLDAGVSYHRGASERNPTSHSTSQLGFTFSRDNGELVKGTCAASGYVEVYEPDWTADAMARWLRDDVLPFCSLPGGDVDEDEQSTLDESEADDVESQGLCDRCEVKTARQEYQGGEYCLACWDLLTEQEVEADD